MTWTEADTHERRKMAVAWLEYACGAPERTEVPEENDRYREVTCNLDPGSRGVHPNNFSTCALLAHWMLLQAGVRSPWLDHPAAPKGWRGDGGVLSRLVAHSSPPTSERPQGGDILIIANNWLSGSDAHVVCVIDVDEDGVWSTAEYGQPGGKLKHARIEGGRFKVILSDGSLSFGRVPRCLVSFKEVLQKAFAKGELVDPKIPPRELW